MAVLYRGGTFFDGTEFYDGHALLLEGKVIKEFGKTSEFDGFAGEVIDTTGMTVMPGLIDCHVHILFSGKPETTAEFGRRSRDEILLEGLKNAQKNLEGGITTIRDCGGRDYIEKVIKKAINKGDFDGPTIHIAGKFICMTGGHCCAIGREADGTDDVTKAVREQLKEGVDHIKIMATGGVITEGVDPEDAHLTYEELKAGVDEAKRFKKPVACHAQGAEGILNAVRAGVTSIEHGIYINEECIEEMLKKNTFLVPTLCAVEAVQGSDAPAFMKEKCDRIEQIHKKAIKAYYDAGGNIAMGTDVGTPGNLHGGNAREVRSMVNVGMTIKDVLTASTRNAADLMQIDNRGRLAKGSFADILIARGDVRQDVEVIANPDNHVKVVKEGRVVVSKDSPAINYALAS